MREDHPPPSGNYSHLAECLARQADAEHDQQRAADPVPGGRQRQRRVRCADHGARAKGNGKARPIPQPAGKSPGLVDDGILDTNAEEPCNNVHLSQSPRYEMATSRISTTMSAGGQRCSWGAPRRVRRSRNSGMSASSASSPPDDASRRAYHAASGPADRPWATTLSRMVQVATATSVSAGRSASSKLHERQQGEDDRRQAARAEPAHQRDRVRGAGACRSSARATGSMRTTVRLSDGVGDRAPVAGEAERRSRPGRPRRCPRPAATATCWRSR